MKEFWILTILSYLTSISKAHSGSITFHEQQGSCGGCLYHSYKQELLRLETQDESLEPYYWCTQIGGYTCSDYLCNSNLLWDPFNCSEGNHKAQYPNKQLGEFNTEAPQYPIKFDHIPYDLSTDTFHIVTLNNDQGFNIINLDDENLYFRLANYS